MKVTDRSVCKRRIIICLITLFAAYSLNGFLLLPLTLAVSTDIVFADTVLPIFLGYLGELIELCAISVCYAAMISLLYDQRVKHIKSLFFIFIGATVYKYFSNTAMSWIISGSVSDIWLWDIVNIVYYSALELLQLTIVYAISKSIIGKYTDRKTVIERASKKAGDDNIAMTAEAFPFEKIYDRKNCILRSAYYCAVITFTAKLAGTLVSDIWAMIIYGMPEEPVTWGLMILNYLSKAIFGAIVYFVIYIAIQRFFKNKK